MKADTCKLDFFTRGDIEWLINVTFVLPEYGFMVDSPNH